MRTHVDVGTDLSMLDIDDLMTEISQLKKEVALLEAKLSERDKLNRKDVSGVSLCVISDQTSPELLVSVCNEEKPSVNLLDCKMEIKTEITETEEQRDEADLIYPDLMKVKEEIIEPNEMEEKPPHFITQEESQSCFKTGKNFSPKQSQGETAKDSITCPQSGDIFTHKCSLNGNMRIHTREKSYRCDQCGKTFVFKSLLTSHMKVHNGEKSYRRDECGKTFIVNFHFNDHMRRHTGVTVYECDQCGKTVHKYIHDEHMRSHTRERPFSCDLCGKTFNRKSHMNEHMRSHTGEKPHRCDQCGRSFARADNLRSHHLCHSGVRPFQCEQCSRTFISVHYLKRHMKTHD